MSHKSFGSIEPFRLLPAKSAATAAVVCAMVFMTVGSVIAQTAPSQEQAASSEQTKPQLSKWKSRMSAHIARSVRRPADAPDSGGAALVAFTIDRKGKVLSADIQQSSGSSALDKATLATVRRASPMPRPPAEIADDPISFTLPVVFHPKVQKQVASSRQKSPRLQKWKNEVMATIVRCLSRTIASASPVPVRSISDIPARGSLAIVGIHIDRTGKVLSTKIIQSSGNSTVDNIFIAGVRGASPLPRPPAEIHDDLTLRLPLRL